MVTNVKTSSDFFSLTFLRSDNGIFLANSIPLFISEIGNARFKRAVRSSLRRISQSF